MLSFRKVVYLGFAALHAGHFYGFYTGGEKRLKGQGVRVTVRIVFVHCSCTGLFKIEGGSRRWESSYRCALSTIAHGRKV